MMAYCRVASSKAELAIMIVVFAGLIRISFQAAQASGLWYVTTSGNDTNDCLSPVTSCATINEAVGKANPGDTIYVTSGTYTNSAGSEVVLVSKSITLTGGWNVSFTVQNSISVIDGENTHRGITVNGDVTASLDHFVIQNGYYSTNDNTAGGIQNYGKLTIYHCTVRNNRASVGTGGIVNEGDLVVNNSSIMNNVGGIYNQGFFWGRGSLILNNSFVGNNSSTWLLGGIYNFYGAIVLNNSTVSQNSCGFSGCGIYNYYGGTVELNNSTFAP
jgi:hypothetical protein